jgi:hypothetical protein
MENIEVELLPDPKRVAEGLRDTGYSFNTAIADIVDNSIAASATDIDLRIKMDFRGELRVSIADNGDGMDLEGLKNAMTYGAAPRANPASLGKYGLGLKTASTAFAKRLSVISRPSGTADPIAATRDLENIKDWKVLFSSPDAEALEHLNSVAGGRAGTVVTWTKVDRLMKSYASPGGAAARSALASRIEGLRSHLAMVYQRFLDTKDKRVKKHVHITVEGQPLKAWDPFVEGLSELVGNDTIPVEIGGGQEASFVVRAFILPRAEEFPSPELEKEAKVAANKQGIYIYRENRMLVEASWLGMYQQEPHGSLLRVEFSFDHKLDDAFHLDIKKSQIGLNDEIYRYLNEQFLPAPRREANRRYRQGEQKKVTASGSGAHKNSNTNIKNREADAGGAEVKLVDPVTGEVEIRNPNGLFRLKIPVGSANAPGEVFVQPVPSISSGLLFEPVLIEQKRGVRINQAHPYYHKVYVPNLQSSVTIQGMDSLLWSLAVAELTAIRDSTSEHFKDLRYEMSRILERLVATLPDPDLSKTDD